MNNHANKDLVPEPIARFKQLPIERRLALMNSLSVLEQERISKMGASVETIVAEQSKHSDLDCLLLDLYGIQLLEGLSKYL